MGLLADLFVAEPEDALTYEALSGKGKLPADRFERAEFKGLTNLEFTTLWALMQNEEWDLDKHDLEAIGEPGETWLFRFPDTFVEALASLDSASISRVVPLWANTEELQWEPSEAQEVIEELVRLARLARTTSKRLFLWGSL